jgi:hypothetical protein
MMFGLFARLRGWTSPGARVNDQSHSIPVRAGQQNPLISGGGSNIAVFVTDQEAGEPNAIQDADTRAAHPRTFSLNTSGKLLVATSLAPTAVREGGKVVVPARPSVSPCGRGRQARLRKYDLDVGTQWWSGMVVLAGAGLSVRNVAAGHRGDEARGVALTPSTSVPRKRGRKDWSETVGLCRSGNA